MLKRLRLGPSSLMLVESALLGLFFVQALRFLIGMLYTRTAGASLLAALNAIGVQPLVDSAPSQAQVNAEIAFTIAMLALPLLALLLIRWRSVILLPILLMVIGRALVNQPAGLSATQAAALVVGAGLMYLAFAARWRATLVPLFFALGLAGDQLIRAAGNTLDPSTFSAGYAPVQVVLSLLVAVIAIAGLLWDRRIPLPPRPHPRYGQIPFWGGLGIGGLLFIQLALLSLPNAVAAKADYDYALLVPLLLIVTLLPAVPGVRGLMRGFIGNFDGGVRGWLWMLLSMLLVVLGTRLNGLLAAAALLAAQFAITLMWWWVVKPLGERDRSFSGIWLLLAAVIFSLLVVADLFTYEAPYVRDFGGNLAFLNDIIPPLLRGFQGMGLAVLILSVFLAALPMTQTRRRIPWDGGTASATAFASGVVIVAAALGWWLARPPTIQAAPEGILRVGTYNIHGGADEFFTPSLNAIADTILRSGSNVLLLQETEAGRLTSFGVDQPLWLARRVGMDRRFYPTVEGLRGLAVLSNVPIAYDDGAPLPGGGEPTGLQRVQVTPNPDTVVTLYNTWLTYLQEATGDMTLAEQESAQQAQLDAIFALIASHHPNGVLGRTILGGTFNNVPDSDLLDQVRAAGFSDPFSGLPIELSATLVREGLPPARIDYVMLRNLSPAEGVLVLNSSASDHRLAVTGIELNP